jgi:hypothetical protein
MGYLLAVKDLLYRSLCLVHSFSTVDRGYLLLGEVERGVQVLLRQSLAKVSYTKHLNH